MINYSFVIPHRNCASLLRRCVQSIPEREDIEIIIVDDNSLECEVPYIDRANVKVVRILEGESKGAGKARNLGLSLASGKWVLFADCDDFYEIGFLDRLDEFKDSNYDIIYFDAYFYYEIKTKTYLESCWHTEDIVKYLENPTSSRYKKLMKHSDNSVWSRMYSKSFLDRIDARFEERAACNDGWFVQYTSAKTDNVVAILDKLYYYVKNAESTTFKKQSLDMMLDRIYAGCKIRRLLVETGSSCALVRHFNVSYHMRIAFSYGFKFFIQMVWIMLKDDVSLLRIMYWKLRK